MIIRTYYPADLRKLNDIHQKYYKNEFELKDFFNHPFNQVVVTEEEEIVCAASTRNILEIVAVTNKDFSVRTRYKALLDVLQVAMNVANRSNFNQLHAFVQDETWKGHLERYGFKDTKGQSLVLNIG